MILIHVLGQCNCTTNCLLAVLCIEVIQRLRFPFGLRVHLLLWPLYGEGGFSLVIAVQRYRGFLRWPVAQTINIRGHYNTWCTNARE